MEGGCTRSPPRFEGSRSKSDVSVLLVQEFRVTLYDCRTV